MSRQRTAHRAEFSVRCACGNEFNTSDTHVGKQLRCRCGRVLTIVRPIDEYTAGAPSPAAPSAPPPSSSARRTKGEARAASAWSRAGTMWSRRHSYWKASAKPSGHPSTPRWPMAARWVTRLTWAYFALTLFLWWALVAQSEEWLPATLLAYGPRWMVALPLLPLVPLTVLAWPRVLRTLAPLALSALVIVWPIMGGRVSLATLGKQIRPVPAEGAMRVMTFNTFGGRAVAARLDETFALQQDIAAFQECGETLFSALQRMKGVYAVKYQSLCTVSRWPITRVDSMPRLENDRGSALAARHHITTPSGPLLFVNVHFETARYGLESLLRKDGGLVPSNAGDIARMVKSVLSPDAAMASQLSFNTVTRTRESARAAQWAIEGAGDTPVIVAGDFNLPVESSIYRRYWSGFRNAFESTGTGFGFTKSEGELLRVRIDHVLGNATAPRATGTWLGPELGSDHRPVLVDFAPGDRAASVEPVTRR